MRERASTRVITLGLFAALAFGAGCNDDPVPPPPPTDVGVDTATSADANDGGTDAGADASDAGTGDAGADAGADAGTDAGSDVGAPDVDLPDMGSGEPVIVCGEEDPDDPVPPPTCGDGCAPGFVCVDAFCGGEECLPGRPCGDDDDCGSGACIGEPDSPGICEAGDGSCAADDDCVYGFACESGECVDRRIPCGFHETNCPRGYTCSFAVFEGLPICVPASVRCDTGAQCELGASCVDVDGDGMTECLLAGRCETNEDCETGTSCGVDPATSQASCEPDGACRMGECADGYMCADTGSGVPRCVAMGGSCATNTDCPVGSICGAIAAADPLRCLTYDEDAE